VCETLSLGSFLLPASEDLSTERSSEVGYRERSSEDLVIFDNR
jgi:hypothetical protein